MTIEDGKEALEGAPSESPAATSSRGKGGNADDSPT